MSSRTRPSPRMKSSIIVAVMIIFLIIPAMLLVYEIDSAYSTKSGKGVDSTYMKQKQYTTLNAQSSHRIFSQLHGSVAKMHVMASMLPPLQSSSSVSYDEQLGMTFTQSFTSMLYYVTAVEQSDPQSGTGPAYLLNGLSNTGYWYQVGLSYDWSAGSGFTMNYEVFAPNGNSIFPLNGGGGVLNFNKPVYPGDSVLLNLYFSNGQVIMLAEDNNTGAYAEESYSAEGASYFVGLPNSTANAEGFFTGLMTEWYHASPYYGNEEKVVYSSSFQISSAWMWIDEFSCSDLSCNVETVLFDSSTDAPIMYINPYMLQEFASNGATEYSDAYEFITGSLPQVTVTVSYSIYGGGAGYSAPVFRYISNGMDRSASLTTYTESFEVDPGSTWSISNELPGSSYTERWVTNQQTEGIAESNMTLSFIYYNQYLISVSYSIAGGGSGIPEVTYTSMGSQYNSPILQTSQFWVDAGTYWQVSNLLPNSGQQERWIVDEPASYLAEGSGVYSFVYQHQFYISINQMQGGQVNPKSGWYNASQQITISAVPDAGWRFEGWNGSPYSGPLNSTTIAVVAPSNETAVFYPGLTIAVNMGGSVKYSYGATSGIISGEQTIYVKPGTAITLSAAPSFFIYSFSGWRGAITNNSAEILLKVDSPTMVSANFGYNYAVIALLIAAVIAIIAAVLAALRKRAGAHSGGSQINSTIV